MVFVLNVREWARSLLGATTHVDGTARVQAVSRSANPLYWRLINEFGKLTGTPIVLNTSFNNNAEPIVDSMADAIACYLTTGLDYLVLGNYLVSKKPQINETSTLGVLTPDFLPSRRLARRRTLARDTFVHEIISVKSPYYGTLVKEISAETFAVLEKANGHSDLQCMAREAGVTHPCQLERVFGEVYDLWTARMVILRPS